MGLIPPFKTENHENHPLSVWPHVPVKALLGNTPLPRNATGTESKCRSHLARSTSWAEHGQCHCKSLGDQE